MSKVLKLMAVERKKAPGMALGAFNIRGYWIGIAGLDHPDQGIPPGGLGPGIHHTHDREGVRRDADVCARQQLLEEPAVPSQVACFG